MKRRTHNSHQMEMSIHDLEDMSDAIDDLVAKLKKHGSEQ